MLSKLRSESQEIISDPLELAWMHLLVKFSLFNILYFLKYTIIFNRIFKVSKVDETQKQILKMEYFR